MAHGSEPEPPAFLAELPGQLLLCRAIAVAVELGVADELTDGPLPPAELAGRVGADPDALYRLLRTLGGHGLFAEDSDGRIVLTPRAEWLRADHTGGMRDMFLPAWQELQWRSYAALPEAVRTGAVAFELAHGQSFFDYLRENDDVQMMFDRRMASISARENDAVADGYDFGACKRVLDVGGGTGGLLAALLTRYPDMLAALYEQPQVLAKLAEQRNAEFLERVVRIAGSFFVDVPSGFDLYLLKRVLHDWDDEGAVAILSRCRRAMSAHARVLVVDAVLRSGNEPDPNKAMDLAIMALTPGRERTGAEFEGLFESAGLQVTRLSRLPEPATLSLIEGEVA